MKWSGFFSPLSNGISVSFFSVFCILMSRIRNNGWVLSRQGSSGWALGWPGGFFNLMSGSLRWFEVQAQLGQSTRTPAHGLSVRLGFSPCGSWILRAGGQENQAQLCGLCRPNFRSHTAYLLCFSADMPGQTQGEGYLLSTSLLGMSRVSLHKSTWLTWYHTSWPSLGSPICH